MRNDMRFEVFHCCKDLSRGHRIIVPCSVGVGYQDGGSMDLWNDGILPPL